MRIFDFGNYFHLISDFTSFGKCFLFTEFLNDFIILIVGLL